MTSYFDHFIVTKIITSYITDSFFILLFVLVLYMVVCSYKFIIPTRIQTIFELIVDH